MEDNITFTTQELKDLKALVAKHPNATIDTKIGKKQSQYDKLPIILGDTLDNILKTYKITIPEITASYLTRKGTLVQPKTIVRYLNVTMKDVNSDVCYSRGVPVRFMGWLHNFIAMKYASIV